LFKTTKIRKLVESVKYEIQVIAQRSTELILSIIYKIKLLTLNIRTVTKNYTIGFSSLIFCLALKKKYMAFSLSKLFSNKTKSQFTDTIDAIITDVENTPFGISENNILLAGLNELGGYFFFQTIIIGQLHVKSKNGAQLLFVGDNFKLQLASDMPEFESESSDIKGRNITKIDFQIEKSDVEKLENATLRSIQIKVKKHDLLFSKYVVIDDSDEEE